MKELERVLSSSQDRRESLEQGVVCFDHASTRYVHNTHTHIPLGFQFLSSFRSRDRDFLLILCPSNIIEQVEVVWCPKRAQFLSSSKKPLYSFMQQLNGWERRRRSWSTYNATFLFHHLSNTFDFRLILLPIILITHWERDSDMWAERPIRENRFPY